MRISSFAVISLFFFIVFIFNIYYSEQWAVFVCTPFVGTVTAQALPMVDVAGDTWTQVLPTADFVMLVLFCLSTVVGGVGSIVTVINLINKTNNSISSKNPPPNTSVFLNRSRRNLVKTMISCSMFLPFRTLSVLFSQLNRVLKLNCVKMLSIRLKNPQSVCSPRKGPRADANEPFQ